MILDVKTRKINWTYLDIISVQLHKILKNQYGILETIIDEVGERIIQLGEKTIGTITKLIGNFDSKEIP
ncbi:hypothetical protein [Flavobacterium sp. ALJ2]|uniref:hypothetical protein n=1 Tax=Flavobacterium sp. ALJ2 TaxID=2786960 RepID=UPI001E494E11|nr:hypothetical protein [Flavobacterium sp. ALJ2]